VEPKTILVDDDDPVLRELVAFNLRREGYACTTAAEAQQAIAMVRQHEPSVVVLDLMMPGVTGLEVCRIVRRESDVPILILTARDEEFDKVLAREIVPPSTRSGLRAESSP